MFYLHQLCNSFIYFTNMYSLRLNETQYIKDQQLLLFRVKKIFLGDSFVKLKETMTEARQKIH